MSSLELTGLEDADSSPVALPEGEFRVGIQGSPPDIRLLVGYCVFGSPDAALLVSLLPQLVHVHGERRLATLVQLVGEESRELRPARDFILARLLEVLLIEALRSTAGTAASPGLLRGLADGRIAAAIRAMHESPTRPWTVAQLANEAALSRSAFFERFSRTVGVAPMEYLLAWRMALAKNYLRRKEGGIAEVAERVGYSSASTFSVAFTRYVGQPPTRYARAQMDWPSPQRTRR
jgi:AraC-like DNA-binding protein